MQNSAAPLCVESNCASELKKKSLKIVIGYKNVTIAQYLQCGTKFSEEKTKKNMTKTKKALLRSKHDSL